MTSDLDRKLVADFPSLYRDRHGNPRVTAMCWGFPGDGWEPLIRRLSEKLAPRGVVAGQVKEKFGALRFYYDLVPEAATHASDADTQRVDHDIQEAEAESRRTCEVCGAPGTVVSSSGWLQARCPRHTPASAPQEDLR